MLVIALQTYAFFFEWFISVRENKRFALRTPFRGGVMRLTLEDEETPNVIFSQNLRFLLRMITEKEDIMLK
jgi:hypothetical protein